MKRCPDQRLSGPSRRPAPGAYLIALFEHREVMGHMTNQDIRECRAADRLTARLSLPGPGVSHFPGAYRWSCSFEESLDRGLELLRLYSRREAVDNSAILGDEKFGEVPLDRLGSQGARARTLE